MKKLLFFLVLLFCSMNISMAETSKPDLIIDNFFFLKNIENEYTAVVVVGNVGTFSIVNERITVRVINGKDTVDFNTPYGLMAGQSTGIFSWQKFIPDSSVTYKIIVDPKNTIKESKEDNNELLRKIGEPIFQITPSRYYHDTLFVLPGEHFSEDLGKIWEVDGKRIIIGLKTNINPSLAQTCDNLSYSFSSLNNGEMNGGYFTISERDFWQCTWVSNSSVNAASNLPLGVIEGTASKNRPGDLGKINVDLEIATSLLEINHASMTKVIKKIDRFWGDINGDGVIDEDDVNKVKRCLDEGTTIPTNIYSESGDRIQAGSVLFGNGISILAYSLIRMKYLYPTDPLPLSAGVGSFMSEAFPLVQKVANTSTVSNNQISIESKEADCYNVIAVIDSNNVFRASGSMDGGAAVVNILDESLDYSIETIRFKNTNISTAIKQLIKNNNISSDISIFNTNSEIRINGVGNLDIQIFDVSGRNIFHGLSIDEKNVDISNWGSGLYLVRINNQNFKIMK